MDGYREFWLLRGSSSCVAIVLALRIVRSMMYSHWTIYCTVPYCAYYINRSANGATCTSSSRLVSSSVRLYCYHD